MNRKRIVRGICAISVIAIAFVMDYLMDSETAPLHGFFYRSFGESGSWQHSIPNIWFRLQTPSIIMGILTQSEAVAFISFLLQWGIVGYLIGMALSRLQQVLRDQNRAT